MKELNFICLLCIAILTTTACSFDDNGDNTCYYVDYEYVTEVTGPETIAINENAVFDVKFITNSDCGEFIRFDEFNTNPKTVKPVVAYTGCNCAEVATIVNKQYTFKVDEAGEYQLKFPINAEDYITKVITVTE